MRKRERRKELAQQPTGKGEDGRQVLKSASTRKRGEEDDRDERTGETLQSRMPTGASLQSSKMWKSGTGTTRRQDPASSTNMDEASQTLPAGPWLASGPPLWLPHAGLIHPCTSIRTKSQRNEHSGLQAGPRHPSPSNVLLSPLHHQLVSAYDTETVSMSI